MKKHHVGNLIINFDSVIDEFNSNMCIHEYYSVIDRCEIILPDNIISINRLTLNFNSKDKYYNLFVDTFIDEILLMIKRKYDINSIEILTENESEEVIISVLNHMVKRNCIYSKIKII